MLHYGYDFFIKCWFLYLWIIYRDLKGDNIFLEARNDGKLIIKLGDFGTSSNKKCEFYYNSLDYYGTRGFMVSFFLIP